MPNNEGALISEVRLIMREYGIIAAAFVSWSVEQFDFCTSPIFYLFLTK